MTCTYIIQHGMTSELTCNVAVFPFELEEQGSQTAFLLLSLFSMAHLHCAGQEINDRDWQVVIT